MTRLRCTFWMFFCLLSAWLLPSHATGQTYTLIYVYDGDTVKLKDHEGEFKLRLSDIDAPERNQAYGKKSRRALSKLCSGQAVTVTAQLTGMDKYQRYLGRMQCNSIDVSLYLTEQGLAWHNIKYSNNPATFNAQQIAKQRRIGLWQQATPTPPWVWRKHHLH